MVSTSKTQYSSRSVSAKSDFIPPLENGDRLDRDEFFRRWEATPEIRSAELIEGVVFVNAAAIRFKMHGEPLELISTWLGNYRRFTPECRVSTPTTLKLDDENVFEPDAILLLRPEFGGTCQVDEDDYAQGAPELVVEVAASSSSRDMHSKKGIYERLGVKEYLVWRVLERELSWFRRDASTNKFVSLDPSSDGVFKSSTLPGLWLHAEGLFADDYVRVLETLELGTASAEHKEFRQRLVDRSNR